MAIHFDPDDAEVVIFSTIARELVESSNSTRMMVEPAKNPEKNPWVSATTGAVKAARKIAKDGRMIRTVDSVEGVYML
jgi:hypothetical protein